MSYYLQVGCDNQGKLEGVSIRYYCDCGAGPNDNSVATMFVWADNGTLQYSHNTQSSIRRHNIMSGA